jgi:hypothetical protein
LTIRDKESFRDGFRAGCELVIDLHAQGEDEPEIIRVVEFIRDYQYDSKQEKDELLRRITLLDEQVKEIRRQEKAGVGVGIIAESVGCAIGTVRDVIKGRSYRRVR